MSGVTDAVGIVTAVALCCGDECGDSGMASTPLVVSFCADVAGTAVYLATPTSVAADKSAAMGPVASFVGVGIVGFSGLIVMMLCVV